MPTASSMPSVDARSGLDGQIRISLTAGPAPGLSEPGEQNAIVGVWVAGRSLAAPGKLAFNRGEFHEQHHLHRGRYRHRPRHPVVSWAGLNTLSLDRIFPSLDLSGGRRQRSRGHPRAGAPPVEAASTPRFFTIATTAASRRGRRSYSRSHRGVSTQRGFTRVPSWILSSGWLTTRAPAAIPDRTCVASPARWPVSTGVRRARPPSIANTAQPSP